MMRPMLIRLTYIAVLWFMCGAASAAPVQWPSAIGGNDHYYDFVHGPGCTRSEAFAAATAAVFAQQTGYLATITSSAENDFLVANFGIPGSLDTAWIGASDETSEGEWLWVTGPEAGNQFWQGGVSGIATPPFLYANWGSTEPNNIPDEDFAVWALDTFGGLWSAPGKWGDANDIGHNANVTGYLVEYSDSVADSDNDGFLDSDDNCMVVFNPSQTDADADGIGNICDQDLNNDCVTNVIDLGIIKSVFFSADPVADFNDDGVVNVIDLGMMKSSFFGAPGPSALAVACRPSCP